MKYIFFCTLAFLIVAFGARVVLASKSRNSEATGNFSDFETYFSALAESNNEDAFLIAILSGTEDFFQFKYLAIEGYQIDFPLITERQQSLEEKIKKSLKSLGLEFEIVKGSDGSRFIDSYIKTEPNKFSGIVTSLYEQVYLADPARNVEFQWYGFDLP